MEKFRLGKTELMVTKSGFGALPIQRISIEETAKLMRKAYDNGINFFDTARSYTDSEEKLGYALGDVRHNIIIATKSGATNKKQLLEHLETSLKKLKTDYIDIYQLHNPQKLPDPNEVGGLYEGLLEAKKAGKIRHISITNHSAALAKEAILSELYDTLQFPLSSISDENDLSLIALCKEHDMGVIAMKAMAGGLITNPKTTFAFLRQYDNVVPIWGVQRESELDDFLLMEKNPPVLDSKLMAAIEQDRKNLSGSFCRGCGYCMPCPVGIEINMDARMSLLLRRAVSESFLTEQRKANMLLIEKCLNCGQCKSKCPYGLDTPKLLKENLADYLTFIK